MSFSTDFTMRLNNDINEKLNEALILFQELKRLIENNDDIKDQVELFHYLDNSSRGKFSKHLLRIIDEIKKVNDEQ